MKTLMTLALTASLLASTAMAGGPVLSDEPDLPTSTVQKDRQIGLLPVLGLIVVGIAIASSGGGGDRGRVVCITETPTDPGDDC